MRGLQPPRALLGRYILPQISADRTQGGIEFCSYRHSYLREHEPPKLNPESNPLPNFSSDLPWFPPYLLSTFCRLVDVNSSNSHSPSRAARLHHLHILEGRIKRLVSLPDCYGGPMTFDDASVFLSITIREIFQRNLNCRGWHRGF